MRLRGILRSPLRRGDVYTGIVCLLPSLAVIAVFVVFPIFFSLFLSFHKWAILTPEKPFVGLANFQRMFASPEFWQCLGNTFLYTAGVVPVGAAASLGLAVLLDRAVAGSGFVRTAFFLPAVASTVVVAVLWQQMYDLAGPFNSLIKFLGFAPREWLGEPSVAMFATVLPQAWAALGVSGLVYLAGLSAIPDELYEDAEIAGAGVHERFVTITLPHLRPLIGISLVGWIMSAARTAEQVFLLTSGGPANATYVVGLDIFNQAYVYIKFGYAMAEVWLLVAVILVFSIYQMRAIRGGQIRVLGS